MTNKLVIRQTTPTDTAQIRALYPLSFPDEDLTPVVSALLKEGPQVLSLASFDGDALVAHVLFSLCTTEGQHQTGSLLGPLGVLPSHQRQGLGDTLVRNGLNRLEKSGVSQVFVLGDPGYYQRFGFSPERHMLAPYPLPVEYGDAWQSMPLASRAPLLAGQLSVPEPWMDAALWGP